MNSRFSNFLGLAFFSVLVISTTRGQEDYGRQRIGVTTDAGSSYRYYDGPPTYLEIERNKKILEERKRRNNAEVDGWNKELATRNASAAKEREGWSNYNAAITKLNQENDRINARINDYNKSLAEYRIAREADTREAYYRIGSSSIGDFDRSSATKYYDDDGFRSSSKMDYQIKLQKEIYQQNQVLKSDINSKYEAMKPERARLDNLNAAIKAWDQKHEAWRSDFAIRKQQYQAAVADHNRRADIQRRDEYRRREAAAAAAASDYNANYYNRSNWGAGWH